MSITNQKKVQNARRMRGSAFAAGHQALTRGLLNDPRVVVVSKGKSFYNSNNFILLCFLHSIPEYFEKNGKVTKWTRQDVEAVNRMARDKLPNDNKIVIASTPAWVDGRYMDLLDGGILHEAAHSMYTTIGTSVNVKRMLDILTEHYDPDVEIETKVGLIQKLWNVFEDAYIERLLCEKYLGAMAKIQVVHEYVWELERPGRLLQPGEVGANAEGQPITGMDPIDHFTCYLRDKVEHYLAGAPLMEYDPKVTKIVDDLFKEEVADSDFTQDTYDTLELALRTITKLKDLFEVSEQQKQGESGEKSEQSDSSDPSYDQGEGQESDQDSDQDGDDSQDSKSSKKSKKDNSTKGSTPEWRDEDDSGDSDDDPEGDEGAGSDEDEGDDSDGSEGNQEGEGGEDEDSKGDDGSEGGDDGDDSDDSNESGEGDEGDSSDEGDDGKDSKGSQDEGGDADENGKADQKGPNSQQRGIPKWDNEILDSLSKAKKAENVKDNTDAMQDAYDDATTDDAPPTVHPYTREQDEIVEIQPTMTNYEDRLYKEMIDECKKETVALRPRMLSFFRGQKTTRRVHRQAKGRRLGRTVSEVIFRDKPRPFQTKTQRKMKDSVVSLVLDESGSMSSQEHQARMILASLALTIGELRIPHEVLGFTTSNKQAVQLDPSDDWYEVQRTFTRIHPLRFRIFRKFDEPFNVNSYRKLTHTDASGLTPLPDAIEFAGSRIVTRKEDQKIMFVVTDGQPYYSEMNWSMADYINMMQNQVDSYKKMGVEVLFVGVGWDASYVKKFENSVHINGSDNFGAKFSQFLMEQMQRLLGQG